jgi:hypothetical protein
VVGRCLHLWPIFYVMLCFGFWQPASVSASFQSTSACFRLWIFASLLSGFLLPFLCLK